MNDDDQNTYVLIWNTVRFRRHPDWKFGVGSISFKSKFSELSRNGDEDSCLNASRNSKYCESPLFKELFLDHLLCWAIFLSAFSSSTFRSMSFFLAFFNNFCDSWRRSRSHRRKGNRRFAYTNGKMQIADLLFSCASWISFRRDKESPLNKD